MERLTERYDITPDGESDVWVKQHDYISAARKLCDYEDLEEQGLLLRLPCKEAYGGECTYEVRITAIDALEKQIPKEPKYKKQLRDFFGVATVVKGDCPCCGKAEIYSNANYCPDCGQKLDWGGGGSEKPCQTNLHQK